MKSKSVIVAEFSMMAMAFAALCLEFTPLKVVAHVFMLVLALMFVGYVWMRSH